MPMALLVARQESCRVLLYSVLGDLCANSGKLPFQIEEGIVLPEIRLLSTAERANLRSKRIMPRDVLNRSEVLKISAVIPVGFFDAVFASQPEPEPPFDRTSVTRLLAQMAFSKRVSDLLVMSNISRVGAIEVTTSAILSNGEFRNSSQIPPMVSMCLREAAQVAEQMKWPSLEAIPLSDVWQWYLKHHQMLEGFDGSATGRALCAFSRLFEIKTQDEPMQLLWALVGLESLYARSKSDLGQQLREKSQAFLGIQQDYKKVVGKMYDFRSRFVHGDLDFPGLCLAGDARDTVARYGDELFEAINVAVALLAGTLQEIIRRNWDGLQFEYTVNNSSK